MFFNKKKKMYEKGLADAMHAYDMIPDKMDEYIFEPFLEALFKECEEGEGYRTFLRKMYQVLYYDRGEAGDESENEPESFLYDFIIKKENICAYFTGAELPDDEEFLTKEGCI